MDVVGSLTSQEPCWRCGTPLEWRHATWQCPRCRFKLGCYEGPTGDCLPERDFTRVNDLTPVRAS